MEERDVPILVISRATWDDQEIIIGTLENISEKVKEAGINKCAQILVGDFIDCNYKKSLLYDKHFAGIVQKELNKYDWNNKCY